MADGRLTWYAVPTSSPCASAFAITRAGDVGVKVGNVEHGTHDRALYVVMDAHRRV
ncbi:MAG: hypothetical protein IPM07_26890 [Anaerolineales bacterium]|nr:hypothetical protein [Anaerolineales bacterium]